MNRDVDADDVIFIGLLFMSRFSAENRHILNEKYVSFTGNLILFVKEYFYLPVVHNPSGICNKRYVVEISLLLKGMMARSSKPETRNPFTFNTYVK